MEHDKKMYELGYRFKLVPIDETFYPVYAKLLMDIGPLMREYPNTHFDIEALLCD